MREWPCDGHSGGPGERLLGDTSSVWCADGVIPKAIPSQVPDPHQARSHLCPRRALAAGPLQRGVSPGPDSTSTLSQSSLAPSMALICAHLPGVPSQERRRAGSRGRSNEGVVRQMCHPRVACSHPSQTTPPTGSTVWGKANPLRTCKDPDRNLFGLEGRFLILSEPRLPSRTRA